MSKKDYIIWGSKGHARVIGDIILGDGNNIVAVVDNDIEVKPIFKDIPLLFGLPALVDWISLSNFDIERLCLAIAIGGAQGQIRQSIAGSLDKVLKPVLISKSASISPTSTIGQGSQVLANAVIAADVVIGEFCIINNSSNVDHDCLLDSGVHIAPGAILCGSISIGANSMVGAGAVVLPYISIGKNVIVGAGSVVTKNISDDQIVAGNPAKKIGSNG